jgi:hypothetical protein
MRSKIVFMLMLSFCAGISGGMIADGNDGLEPEKADDAFL